MENITKTTLMTSLITLSTALMPFASNAQMLFSNNCMRSEQADRIVELNQGDNLSVTCLHKTVETIYNPSPNWKPNL